MQIYLCNDISDQCVHCIFLKKLGELIGCLNKTGLITITNNSKKIHLWLKKEAVYNNQYTIHFSNTPKLRRLLI